MTKTCAKIGGRETLKVGVISKLQRHIVSQQKLLIVIFFFIAAHEKRLLDPSLLLPDVYVCFRTPGPLLVDFYMLRTICHNLATLH